MDYPVTAFFRFRGTELLVPDTVKDADISRGIEMSLLPELHFSGDFSSFDFPMLDNKTWIRVYQEGDDGEIPPDWHMVGVRAALFSIATVDTSCDVSRLFRACHLSHWKKESAFCGRCGTANTDASDEFARLCPQCGKREYPRISPAIIVLITDDEDRTLLAHNYKFKEGMYSLVAGFVEAGEDLEDTVAREIREEVGIEVQDITYVVSQAWPFPESLMLGFHARYRSGTIHPDGKEIADAAWFTRDTLPNIPSAGSVSRSLIDMWLAGKLKTANKADPRSTR